MIIQKEEAVFTYNLFSLFIKILIHFTFVVANIRIISILSKFSPSFFYTRKQFCVRVEQEPIPCVSSQMLVQLYFILI